MVQALDAITEMATDKLRRYQPSGADDTNLLRGVARHLVDPRQLHETKAGEPDWQGRSYEYRRLVSTVYDGSGVDRADRPSLSAKVSYHVALELRERLAPHELRRPACR